MTTNELDSLWRPPPELLQLTNKEVHIWRASLDLPETQIQGLEQLLAPDERARTARFHFPKDRTHFIAARGILRTILGRYLNREPHTLQFHYSEYGKPALIQQSSSDILSFNVTHAHTMALYAITHNQNIGIDLEWTGAKVEYEQLAERFFSPHEVSMLRSVPPSLKKEAFFNCWTRKEAYIKARGMGLLLPLDQFDVSLIPGEPAALLNTREEGQHTSSWSLYELAPGSNYIAALAIEGLPHRLLCWQYRSIE